MPLGIIKYLEMAVDCLPENIVLDYEISNIKVLFKKEATLGDTLILETDILEESNSITTVHRFINRKTDKVITKLELKWRKLC